MKRWIQIGLLLSVAWTTPPPAAAKTVFQSGFEESGSSIDISDFELDNSVAYEGHHSLRGQVTEPKQARMLLIPHRAQPGCSINISLMVRSDHESTCAVFWLAGKKKTSITRIKQVPVGRWTFLSGSYTFDQTESGAIQIAAPSSYGAPPGCLWIDQLLITESGKPMSLKDPSLPKWSDRVVDFPAVTADQAETVWLATLERPEAGCAIGVYTVKDGRRKPVCTLEIDGITGIAAPAVAGLARGALVVFPFEKDDRWRLAYAFVDGSSPEHPKCRIIECGGTANISPALAVTGNRVQAVWESNAPGHRAILSCQIGRDGASQPAPISDTNVNSYNPAITALKDGALFAAWDTFRNRSADIYGARWTTGNWAPERRLTADARIERYPFLASRGNEVWMSWQAQAYQGMSVGTITEQKILVARIDPDGLKAPVRLEDSVFNGAAYRLRPRVFFDPDGRLWLTARESDGPHAGWHSVVWVCSGTEFNGPTPLAAQPGRWRPTSLLWTKDGGIAAVQIDDVPSDRAQEGINDDWHSDVQITSLPTTLAPAPVPPKTKPLVMPATKFSLPAAMDLVSAGFPRQHMEQQGRKLTLYWGDLHAHTDISICQRSGNQPGHDLFANRRDIEQLDFCALTDHGYDFDNPIWAYNGEQTRNNHDPGYFVAFLGQEWTSTKIPPAPGKNYYRYGHRNLIYEDSYYHHFHDSRDGPISPSDIWKTLEQQTGDFVTIPHQLADWKGKGGGNPPTDWTQHNEVHQPVAEIFQVRGSYEYLGCPRQAGDGAPFKGNYLQDAWAQGIVIGVIASPDHTGGAGKAAVWTEDFTRKGLLDAIHARHTYGTSGAKMLMKFSATCSGTSAMMGDKIPRPEGPVTFTVEGAALRNIREMVIFRNNVKVFEKPIGNKQFSIRWTDPNPPMETSWYYARFQAEDEELAWSSPIWFAAE